MELNDRDILLASMIGVQEVQAVPRFEVVENRFQKMVGLPIAFLPFRNRIGIEHHQLNVDTSDVDTLQTQVDDMDQWLANRSVIDGQFFPLLLRRAGSDDPFFALPFEPLISVSGKNRIAKRSIAKAPNFVGTIKERWSQDDYQITITGVLMGSLERGNYEESYPRDDFEQLKKYCISETGLEVQCDMLQQFGINNIVIEEFNFPFSKGENVQAYDIKAVSDFTADFLLEIND